MDDLSGLLHCGQGAVDAHRVGVSHAHRLYNLPRLLRCIARIDELHPLST
jgi:hypothetical protein